MPAWLSILKVKTHTHTYIHSLLTTVLTTTTREVIDDMMKMFLFKRPRRRCAMLLFLNTLSFSSSSTLTLTSSFVPSCLSSLCHPTMRSVSSHTNLNFSSWTQLMTRKKHMSLSNAMATKNHSNNNNNNNNEWEAGDWESDFKALESAVALCNASTDLAQKERLDLLDYFALQRRDLIPDVIHFIIRPIVMAWALVLASTTTTTTTTTSHYCVTIRTLSRLLMVVSNIHFWTMCLFIPTLHNILMTVKPLQRRRKNEWEMEYIDPRDDTSHSPRCLLENWALSYTPMALFGVAITVVNRMPSIK
jgi:hypothetical protein